jgi:hypothetical protein
MGSNGCPCKAYRCHHMSGNVSMSKVIKAQTKKSEPKKKK